MTIEQTDNFIASLGYEAYRVGGSVRDEIIGRQPKDADYMIRGASLIDLYGELISSLRGTAKITDLILRDGQHVGYRVGRPYDIEITLPRREESTGPGHGDFKIVVDPSITLEEDAKRRDFTFNALYKPVGAPADDFYYAEMPNRWNGPGDVVLDPTGRGLDDLRRRIINVTHVDSFRDDPLRILRALRFVARGYDLGSETHALMSLHSDAITGLTYKHEAKSHIETMDGGYTIVRKRMSGDYQKEMEVMSGTVYTEMNNILMGSEAATALRVARDTGVLGVLFPELAAMLGFDQSSKYHDLTTDEHTFVALDNAVKAGASLRVRWALLFHDSGKPAVAWRDEKGYKHFYAKPPKQEVVDPYDGHLNLDHEEQSEYLWREAAERMGTDKKTREDVAILIRHHMVPYKSRGVAERTRRMRVYLGDDLLRDLLLHRLCDLLGKDGSANQKHVNQIAQMESYRAAAQRDKIPTSVRDLHVGGRDVIAMGAIPGPDVARVLRALLDEVVVRGDEMALSRDWQFKAAERLV